MILPLSRSINRSRRQLILLVALIAALPVLITPLPVLTDYSAHLARYHIEMSLNDSPALARFYTYRWRYLPNLGVDIAVAGLARLIGVELAGKIAVAAIPAIGAAAMLSIGRTVHGRVTFATLMAVTLNYAFPFIFGFVNSCLSVSLALAVFAAWLPLDRDGRRTATTVLLVLAAPIVMTAHVIGFGVLGLLVGGAAVSRATESGGGPVSIVAQVLRRALPLAWPLPVLSLWQMSGSATISRFFDWQTELRWLAMIVRDHFAVIDVPSAIILYVVALLPLIAPRRFVAERILIFPALFLWAFALLMPNRMFGSEFAAVRLICVALAVTLLAVRDRGPAHNWLITAGGAFLAFRLGTTTLGMLATSNAAQAELTALNYITPGSRVAAVRRVECPRQWAPPRLKTVASYATVRRDSFVNGGFTAVEGQLLGLQPTVSSTLAAVPTIASVDRCERLTPMPLAELVTKLPWSTFDYLWLIDIGNAPIQMPGNARMVWTDDRSRLYAIDHRQS